MKYAYSTRREVYQLHRRGWTRKDISKMLKIPYSTISRILREMGKGVKDRQKTLF